MGSNRNLVQQAVANTPGTGNLTLGAAFSGFLGLEASDDGKSFNCTFSETGLGQEVRTGCVYTHSGTALTRGTLEKSTTGAAISFTAAVVMSVTLPASVIDQLEYQLDRATTIITTNGSTQQSISGGAGTYVITNLDTVVANPYGWWDGSTNKFTPLRAGTYLVYAAAQVVQNVQLSVGVYKNGSVDVGGANFATVAYTVSTAVGLIIANGSTDYFEVRAYAGANCTIYENNGYFRAVYLGG